MATKPRKVTDDDSDSVTGTDPVPEADTAPEPEDVTSAPELEVEAEPMQEIAEPAAPVVMPHIERAERAAPRPIQPIPFPAPQSKLPGGRIKGASHARVVHFADIPARTEPERLLDPSYWAHYTDIVRPLSQIEAFCEDGSWEGLFRVMRVGTAEILIKPLYIVRYDEQHATDDSDMFEVRWVGPTINFAVVNRHTGAVVADHLFPESAAYEYLRRHLSEMKR